MIDERLDYSYRKYRHEDYKHSKDLLRNNLRLLYFHFGRYSEGARDRVAKDAYEIYVTRHAGTDALYHFNEVIP